MAGGPLERAAAALSEGDVVAFTGAGVSADSGVPTFRDPAGLRTAFVPSLESVLPRCNVCGGPTRPGFVAFGERPLRFEEASARAATCAAMLVVGTAGEVEPAAALPRLARAAGAAVVHVG